MRVTAAFKHLMRLPGVTVADAEFGSGVVVACDSERRPIPVSGSTTTL
jgi:hypothetical protein